MPTPAASDTILDTHVWLALASGGRKLTARALRRVEQASRRGRLTLSAVSVFETLVLVQRGKLTPKMDARAWTTEMVRATGVNVAVVDLEVAIVAGWLSGIHADPADRLIVATAIVRD